MVHYRRLTRAEFDALKDRLSERIPAEEGEDTNLAPSDYDTLASIGGVEVGRDGAGARLVHVNRDDSPDLPGTFAGRELGDLRGAAYRCVARARVRVRDEKGEDTESTVPEAEIPEDAEVIESGLAPHEFAH